MPLQNYDSKQKNKQEQLLLFQKFQALIFNSSHLQGRWMSGEEIVLYLNGIDEDDTNNGSTSIGAFNTMITKRCPITNDYYLFPTGGSLYTNCKNVEKKKNGKAGKVRFYFVKIEAALNPTTPTTPKYWTKIYQRYLDLDLDDDDESPSTGNKKKRTRT